jgi:hypothetical protein
VGATGQERNGENAQDPNRRVHAVRHLTAHDASLLSSTFVAMGFASESGAAFTANRPTELLMQINDRVNASMLIIQANRLNVTRSVG